ncbi:unnamed protein product [Lathyrus sativus]|nr:unnamed protein product [Lathyrus sativus]
MLKSFYLSLKGSFSFNLCRRNDILEKKGLKPPNYLKTGTTIVGFVFQVADLLVFVTSARSSSEETASHYIDMFGNQCLSVFKSLGFEMFAITNFLLSNYFIKPKVELIQWCKIE